ncbi:MAG: hypothetical protein FWC01_01100 [Treponema sp.]|nr:hypothetical protein [Treponema sp.]MCL2236791.1 hypothetical protein [Treponema sp.]
MKQNFKFLGLLIVITAVVFASCASVVRIRSDITSVIAGGMVNLRVSGSDLEVKVSSTPDGSGPVAAGTFVSSRGLLTVDPRETALFLYVIARSTKEEKSDTMQIRVVTVDSVVISPASGATAVASRTLQLSAQVTGNNNPDRNVTWKVGSNNDGTGSVTAGTAINNNGLLTVAREETFRTLFVTATSSIDTSKSSTVLINIVVPTVTGVTVTPTLPTLQKGTSFQFQAVVVGLHEPSQAVTWRVSSNAAGTGAVAEGTFINASGLLTVAAAEPAATLFITATSVFDPTKSGSVVTFDIQAAPAQ